MWAKGTTTESKKFAIKSIKQIIENANPYLKGDKGSAQKILKAANLAGKAINISKTTAAHAMSYKLTSMLGVAHGYAVALCMSMVWEHLLTTPYDFDYDESMVNELVSSVNLQRLSNHPVKISEDELADMYRKILWDMAGGGMV
jgi:alcohol dehydrogenase class IV